MDTNKINNVIEQIETLIPQMESIIQNNDSFIRYIFPALIAGVISIIGIFINSFISLTIFKKNRNLMYGKFYIPYLFYLRKIVSEIELFCIANNRKKSEIFKYLIIFANDQQNRLDGHLHLILELLNNIESLLSKDTYYVINKDINENILKIQKLIIYIDICKDQQLDDKQLEYIVNNVVNLNVDFEKHIKLISNIDL